MAVQVAMDLFQHRYYRTAAMFMSIIGQWPYEAIRLRYSAVIAMVSILVPTQVIPFLLAMIKCRNDLPLLLECAIPILLSGVLIVKFSCVISNSRKMLTLLNRIRSDWQVWAQDREINILHKYAERGRQFTIGYAVAVYSATLFITTQPIMAKIVDNILNNGTKPGEFPFPAEFYNLDTEKYYFYISFWNVPCQALAITVTVATDSIFIVYVQHCCGIFSALGNKLERLEKNGKCMKAGGTGQVLDNLVTSSELFHSCINRHNDAIEYAELIESTYTWCLFGIVGLNMLGISILGIQVFKNINNHKSALRFGVFLCIDVIHLFMESYMSQMLMDHSIRVRDNIYNSDWYRLSSKSRQFVLFMIMRCNIPCRLTAGKIATMSMETFAALLKTSLSYFTLLRSV